MRSLGVLVAMMGKELKELRKKKETEIEGLRKQLAVLDQIVAEMGRELMRVRGESEYRNAILERTQKLYEKAVNDHRRREAEREREKSKGVDSGMQSEEAEMAATGTQTMRHTYASVVAQTEDTGEVTNVGGPSGASRGEGGQPADPATKKPTGTTPVGDRPVRAFVVHVVACSGPWAHRSREMEKAFGRRGGSVIGMRWLLQRDRRWGRSSTSMVVYLRRAIPTAEDMYVRVWVGQEA